MRRELLERGFGQFGKNKSAFLPPQRKDASTLEIGERVNRLNPSMLAVLVQMLRMGTHCLVKEFHPEFHVEVIRRPHTCALAQLVPYDLVLFQHGWFVVEPRHFLRNRVHQHDDVETAARKEFQKLKTEATGDHAALCSQIYRLFHSGGASKAVGAQHLAERLVKLGEQTAFDKAAFGQTLPSYIVDAIA